MIVRIISHIVEFTRKGRPPIQESVQDFRNSSIEINNVTLHVQSPAIQNHQCYDGKLVIFRAKSAREATNCTVHILCTNDENSDLLDVVNTHCQHPSEIQ